MKPFLQKNIFPNNEVLIIFHRDYINKDMYYPLHFHKAIEMCFMLTGEGQANSNGEQKNCREGDLVIFNSGNVHYIKALTQPVIYYCMIIKPEVFENIGFDVEKLNFPLVVNSEKIKQQFIDIAKIVNNNDKYSKIITKLKVQILITTLIGQYAKDKDDTAQHNIKQTNLVKLVIKYINDNYYKQINIEEMCEEIGFSKSYVYHTFRQITGQTITNYANHLRCKKAKTMLSTNKYSVSEVAEFCGITNFSYFSKLYKKHIGVLPSKDYSSIAKSETEK